MDGFFPATSWQCVWYIMYVYVWVSFFFRICIYKRALIDLYLYVCTSTASTCVCVARLCSWRETCFNIRWDFCQSKHQTRLDWGGKHGLEGSWVDTDTTSPQCITAFKLIYLVTCGSYTALWCNCTRSLAQLSGWSMAITSQGKHVLQYCVAISSKTYVT